MSNPTGVNDDRAKAAIRNILGSILSGDSVIAEFEYIGARLGGDGLPGVEVKMFLVDVPRGKPILQAPATIDYEAERLRALTGGEAA